MFCAKCGTRIEEDGRFCPNCGTPVPVQKAADSAPVQKEAFRTAGKEITQPPEKKASKPTGKLIAGLVIGLLVLAVIAVIALLILKFAGSFLSGRGGQDKEEWSALAQLSQESEQPEEEDREDEQSGESMVQGDEAETEQTALAESEVSGPVINSYECIKMDCTWSEAERMAEAAGGHLVTINSEEENIYVKNLLTLEGVKIYWIGANDLEDGTYAWIDGTQMLYTDWHDGEPNWDQGIEHYASMYQINGEWKWNDLPEDVSQYYSGILGFVIEYETNAQ